MMTITITLRKAIILAFLLPLLLNASSSFVLKDDSLKPEATEIIDKIGNELFTKAKVNAYVLATNEAFPIGFNLVEYSQKFTDKMEVPFVLYIFAPNALITQKSKSTGRVGLISSSDDIKTLYDYDDVRDAGLDIIAVKDKNSISDKHNIGVVQAYSELADQIAEAKNIKMSTTIPNDTRWLISIIRIILLIGLALVTWIYLIRPIMNKRKRSD
jgi:ATP-dependent Zn protease